MRGQEGKTREPILDGTIVQQRQGVAGPISLLISLSHTPHNKPTRQRHIEYKKGCRSP
jgi:hypothetical protein